MQLGRRLRAGAQHRGLRGAGQDPTHLRAAAGCGWPPLRLSPAPDSAAAPVLTPAFQGPLQCPLSVGGHREPPEKQVQAGAACSRQSLGCTSPRLASLGRIWFPNCRHGAVYVAGFWGASGLLNLVEASVSRIPFPCPGKSGEALPPAVTWKAPPPLPLPAALGEGGCQSQEAQSHPAAPAHSSGTFRTCPLHRRAMLGPWSRAGTDPRL